MSKSDKKSLSQTPAPKKDRIYGSKVNPKGSASSEKTAKDINLSAKTLSSLSNKLKEFKEKNKSKDNVNINDLKAVYRRGSGAYSSSHRPTISGGKPNSRNAWAMARVNAFLRKAGGGEHKKAYVQDDDLLKMHLGGDMSKHLAPNGKPSNLTHEQWHLVRTPEFKAWFGDWENDPNKWMLLDENGEPLVFWHTGGEWYELNKEIGNGELFFSLTETIYSESNYQSSIKRPFFLKSDYIYVIKYEKRHNQSAKSNIKNKKYPIWFIQGVNFVIVKNSEQIKLADGSNTTFDSSNPDIRYEDGGELEFDNIDFDEAVKQFRIAYPLDDDRYLTSKEKRSISIKSFYGRKRLEKTIGFDIGNLPNLTQNQHKIRNRIYELLRNDRYKNGGEVGQEIICVNCGWNWNTKDSEDYDKYICHNCGFNNRTFYDADPIGFKEGGEVEKHDEIYKKWRSLVNMSSSELKRFYDSEEGKKAGLSAGEAKSQGINSGRESARWIMKMKKTPKSKWTDNMWRWANKQISFISRMSGVKGSLYKPNGEKSRKHLALLIWGHNPNKKNMGGDTLSLPDATSGSERLKEILDMQGYDLTKRALKKAPTLEEISYKHGVSIPFLEEQLEMGIKEEMEHTNNKEVAETIALQHLDEDYKYYTHLYDMMQRAKAEDEYEGSIIELINVKSMKKGGEVDPDNKEIKDLMTHKSGNAGGLLVGNRHSEGGIKAVNKSTDQPLEMEGGEVVITRNAVSDDKKRMFDGEMLTNREILSRINESGGGVSFEDGGKVNDDCGCNHYDDGGNVLYKDMQPSEAFDRMFEDGGEVHESDSYYDKGGLIRLVNKKVASLKEFISKNSDINHLSQLSSYKNYLKKTHKLVFNDLPQQIKMGLLLGNQKLVDNYLNN